MTTTGFKNIPFTVNVSMLAAIHADHHVSLGNGGDGRLTFPSGGTGKTFTPANWMTGQPLLVNVNGSGDIVLVADVTNDYFVNGAGVHRTKRFVIDLNVSPLPLDTWTGTVPKWAQASGGDLTISHNNLVAGDTANLSRTAITGLTFDKPFNFNSAMSLLITAPDGSQTVVSSAFSAYAVDMTQIGIYAFAPIQPFALLQKWDAGTGHVIQGNTFQMSVTRSGGTVTVVPARSVTAKSQGVGYADASLLVRGLSAAFGPIAPQTLPVGGPSEATFLGSLTMAVVGTPFLQRATGSATGSGATAVFTGSVTSGGGWQIAYDAGSGQIDLSNDGVVCANALTMSVGS